MTQQVSLGQQKSALKGNVNLLKDFGKDPQSGDFNIIIEKAEEYLVQVYKPAANVKTMDELRFSLYHHSKCGVTDLPPTSYTTKGHILRAFYTTHIQLHCFDMPDTDPHNFGFEDVDGLLVPSRFYRIIPDDLPQSCTCKKCATRRCICREAGISCCVYCGCSVDESACKNPNVLLRVPVSLPRTPYPN